MTKKSQEEKSYFEKNETGLSIWAFLVCLINEEDTRIEKNAIFFC